MKKLGLNKISSIAKIELRDLFLLKDTKIGAEYKNNFEKFNNFLLVEGEIFRRLHLEMLKQLQIMVRYFFLKKCFKFILLHRHYISK